MYILSTITIPLQHMFQTRIATTKIPSGYYEKIINTGIVTITEYKETQEKAPKGVQQGL